MWKLKNFVSKITTLEPGLKKLSCGTKVIVPFALLEEVNQKMLKRHMEKAFNNGYVNQHCFGCWKDWYNDCKKILATVNGLVEEISVGSALVSVEFGGCYTTYLFYPQHFDESLQGSFK